MGQGDLGVKRRGLPRGDIRPPQEQEALARPEDAVQMTTGSHGSHESASSNPLVPPACCFSWPGGEEQI